MSVKHASSTIKSRYEKKKKKKKSNFIKTSKFKKVYK